MKILKTLMAAVSIVLLITSLALPFDKAPGKFKEFDVPEGTYVDLSDGWVEVTILGHAEGLYPVYDDETKTIYAKRGVGLFGQNGSGFHLGGGYIVTNAHVVTPKSVTIPVTKYFSYVTFVDRVLDIEYMFGSDTFGKGVARVVWVNEELDLALLWADPKVHPCLMDYGYRTTWTWESGYSLIEDGDIVAAIVKVRDEDGLKSWNYEVRYGKVISRKPVLPEGVGTDFLPWFSLNDFTIDIPLYPGDSGSPIFAFTNGKPVIIGLGRASVRTYTENYSYATRIDRIHLKCLER